MIIIDTAIILTSNLKGGSTQASKCTAAALQRRTITS